MSRFRVQLRGKNFLLNIDGEPRKFGFSATRIVKALDIDRAKKIAIIRLHQELNNSDHRFVESPDSPKVSIQQIDELGKLQLVRKKTVSGFDFYPDEDQPEPISIAISD